jgi:hypothetical protein
MKGWQLMYQLLISIINSKKQAQLLKEPKDERSVATMFHKSEKAGYQKITVIRTFWYRLLFAYLASVASHSVHLFYRYFTFSIFCYN